MNNKIIYRESTTNYVWNRYEIVTGPLASELPLGNTLTKGTPIIEKTNGVVHLSLSNTTTYNVLSSVVGYADMIQGDTTISRSIQDGNYITYADYAGTGMFLTKDQYGDTVYALNGGTVIEIHSGTSFINDIRDKFIILRGSLYFVPMAATVTPISYGGIYRLDGIYKVTAENHVEYTTYDTWDCNLGYQRAGRGSATGTWINIIGNNNLSRAVVLSKDWSSQNLFYHSYSGATLTSTTNVWQLTNTNKLLLSDPTVVTSATDDYPHDQWTSPYFYEFVSGPGSEQYFDNALLYGGVNYSQVVNTEDDIEVGPTAGAYISFKMRVINGLSEGLKLVYKVKQEHDNNYRTIGSFYITGITKGEDRYTITAYDGISKFDKVVDEWLENHHSDFSYYDTEGELVEGWTLREILTSLCTYCGVSTNASSFVNSTFKPFDNFESTNLTGRYILSYIAQLGAGFAICNASGELEIKTLGYLTATLTNQQYVTLWQADYSVLPITKVRVAYDEESEGVEAGSGDNVLGIYGNPLLYFSLTSEISTQVTNIYNQLNPNSTYVPMSITALEDFLINAGTKIIIGDSYTYVFSKSWNHAETSFESTGNKKRLLTNVNKNSEINSLRGKVHRLTVDVNGLSSQVIDASVKASKSLTWDAVNGLTIQNDTTGNHVRITGDDIQTNAITATNIAANTITLGKFDPVVQALINSGSIIKQGNIPTQNPQGQPLGPSDIGQLWFCTTFPTGGSQWVAEGHTYAVNDLVYITTTQSGVTTTTYYLCIAAHTSHTEIEDDIEKWLIIQPNTFYSYTGTTWRRVSNPNYVTATYIDSTLIRSPEIVGNAIYVNADNGGSFRVAIAGTTVGALGAGRYSGSEGTKYGAILACDNNGDNYIDTDNESFVLAAPDGVLIKAGTTALRLTKDGLVEVRTAGGSYVPLGYARFG